MHPDATFAEQKAQESIAAHSSARLQQQVTPSHVEGEGKGTPIAPPGVDLPTAVYRTVFLCYLWMVLAAWLAFGTTTETDLNLAVVTVICLMFAIIPLIIQRIGRSRSGARPPAADEFVSSSVDTYTGPLTGSQVWIQILVIPLALALAATLIGIVHAFVTPLHLIN